MADIARMAAAARADAGHAVYPRLHCLFGEAQRHDVVPDETAPVVNLLGQLGRVARRADDDLDAISPAQVEVRSEEHTSELQSLMRISYAVFCLKKKI